MRINCNAFHCSSGSCWLNPYGTEPMLRRYSSCQHYSHHTLYTANKWGKVGVLAGESEQQREAKCSCFFNNYVKHFHSSVSMWDGLLQQVRGPLNLMNLTMRRVVTKTWLDKANDICSCSSVSHFLLFHYIRCPQNTCETLQFKHKAQKERKIFTCSCAILICNTNAHCLISHFPPSVLQYTTVHPRQVAVQSLWPQPFADFFLEPN